MSFKTIQVKQKTFDMLDIAKLEYVEHHSDWATERISNNKIVYEALRYYIGTGKYKHQIDMDGEK